MAKPLETPDEHRNKQQNTQRKELSPAPDQPQHWAVKLFLNPREEFQDNLVPGKDYPEVDYYQALQSFDPESLRWVPLWFPRQNQEGQRLSPEQRLAWFEKALEHYAQEEWPPKGSLSSRKRAMAVSLLHMLFEQELQGIPVPDKL